MPRVALGKICFLKGQALARLNLWGSSLCCVFGGRNLYKHLDLQRKWLGVAKDLP
jgi:hypothetical protein